MNAQVTSEAGWFGPAERPLFGWLHRPAAPARSALVIVPPFGFEAVCAARSLRHFAEAAAGAGLLALRFDLDGTGDSAGGDLDPDRLGHWLDSIDAACEFARKQGARNIVLAGVRLGASLAALAAERRGDIAGYVAIAAVPNGKALLREGNALQAALALTPAPVGEAPAERELVGFAVADETWAAISAIDLCRAQKPPAPEVLLIDRDDRPANDAWAAHLAALGAAVERTRLPGYVEMTLDPHNTQVPIKIIEALLAFARRIDDNDAAPAAAIAPTRLSERTTLQVGDAEIVEEALRIDQALFAIAARPVSTPTHAVVFLNAGAVGHIGPNRLYVALCRQLAASGALALRCDLSGIGDAAARDGAEENIVYHRHAIDDVAALVRAARDAGADHVAVAGLCSGGYHALRAAIDGQPIDTVVVINPLTFRYTPGAPLDVAAFRAVSDARRYRQSIGSSASWRKLLRGDVSLARVAMVVVRRVRSRLGASAKNLLRTLRIPLREDLGSELRELARRGVAVRFVFASDDPGRVMLAEQGGAVVSQLARTGKLAVQMIDGADHTFTSRWTHAAVIAAIAQAAAGL